MTTRRSSFTGFFFLKEGKKTRTAALLLLVLVQSVRILIPIDTFQGSANTIQITVHSVSFKAHPL